MGRTENGGGDQLARGATKVQFRPAGSKVSEKAWNDMFEGFDPEKFKSESKPKENGKKELNKRR